MRNILPKLLLLCLFFLALLFSCQNNNDKENDEKDSNKQIQSDLPWLQNAVVYKVNLKQFSTLGNFKGFINRIDTLKDLGVDIIWFNSLQPVSFKENSSVLSDFKSVNPQFGTIDEFRNLVEKCHEKKLKVIINWEASHLSKESKIVKEHADWFKPKGQINAPTVEEKFITLNYADKNVKEYMIETMKWWIDEFDIDGFNIESKGVSPDFCKEANNELNQMKRIFFMSDSENAPSGENNFDALHSDAFYNLLKNLRTNAKGVDSLIYYINKTEAEGLKLNYLEKSEINSETTQTETFGEAQEAFSALIFTIKGIPMILNGTEAGYNKQTNKNPIFWNGPLASKQLEFYKTLISIRHQNPALWNNVDGQTNTGVFKSTKDVCGFIRQSGENKVLVVINFSDKTVKMDALEIPALEQYSLRLYKNMKTDGVHLYELGPWGYSVSTLNEPREN